MRTVVMGLTETQPHSDGADRDYGIEDMGHKGEPGATLLCLTTDRPQETRGSGRNGEPTLLVWSVPAVAHVGVR
jgi:hypothetical protein